MLSNFLRFKIFATIIILVVIDQIIKNAALAFLTIPQSINSLLSLEIYKNYGIAFGLPISAGVYYLAVFVFLILILIGRKKGVLGDWSEMDKGKKIAIALIAAGALGNMIDRIRFGYIIDYINIGGMLVFNLADAMIAAGVLILFKDLIFKKTNKLKMN